MSLKRLTASILRRRERLPLLSTALFGPRTMGYARRRLLFPMTRMTMMAFFHALEAAALLLIFDPRFLVPIISLRLGSSLASGAIWGATEALRQDLRALPARDPHHALGRRIEEALARTSFLAILLVVAAVLWVWRFPQVGPGYFSVIDAYVLALAFRVSLSWVSRTYHSGLLAKRRVYRPKWSLILPDLFDGLGLFIFWRLLGPWSIALTVVGSSLLHGALSYHYSRRGYRDAGMPLPRFLRRARLRLPSASLAKRWGLSVCIGLSCELPSVFVLGQWHSLAGGADATAAMLLYWARPFASFLSSIPRIYYVDLVGTGELGPIASRRLRRGITRVILVLGTFLSLACMAGALLYATEQGALALLLYLSASTFLAIFTLRALNFMIFGYAPSKLEENPTLGQFLESTRNSQSSCEAIIFELGSKEPARIAHALAEVTDRLEGASACRLGRRYLLCVSTISRGHNEWLLAFAGTATPVTFSSRSSSGEQALRSLYESKDFPLSLRAMLAGPSDIGGLQALITANDPEAQVLRSDNWLRLKHQPGSLGDLRHAIRQYQGAFPPRAALWGQDQHLLLVLAKGRPDWMALINSKTPASAAADLRRQTWNLGIRRAWLGPEGLNPDENTLTLTQEKEA